MTEHNTKNKPYKENYWQNYLENKTRTRLEKTRTLPFNSQPINVALLSASSYIFILLGFKKMQKL